MHGAAPHEKLVAYRKALDAAAALEDVARQIPRWRADLQDQLRRASASMPLNIAEGAGEFSKKDKARFYRIARRSSLECLAVLDLLSRIADPSMDLGASRRALREVGVILTALVKSVEE